MRLPVEMRETIEMMESKDYKERFKAEYWQTKIRYHRLHDMLIKYEANTLKFKPNCSIGILENQQSMMEQYLYWLEVRAEIECIDLDDIPSQRVRCAED